MADNTAQARKSIEGHRKAIREHIDKYWRYTQDYEKEGALRTIRQAQDHIRRLKQDHPSLAADSDSLDTWKP